MRNRLFGLLALGAILGSYVVAGSGDAQAQKEKGAQAVFEVYQDKQKEFRYRLVAGDEKIAMSPRGYKTKADLMKVIEAVRREAPKAKLVEETKK